ncbi:hypothetical protein [Mangrovibacterium sp.]|uniref:hypothetical protein n=1 Tax=Mangrovibacterium sp. TaxID=1961364 RepID=UPI003567BD4B
MAINCNSKNPLQRDGTSQAQRQLKTLLPGYVAVDERSMDDLIAFAGEFAKEIYYFKPDNTIDPDPLKSNWYDFFNQHIDPDSQLNSPHFALFIAFLKLFKYAQDDINQWTKKHLDFYYRDVLHLTAKPAVPDQVYLIFELAKHVSTHLLEKETSFKAGKDELGNNVVYKLDEETSLNKATLAELKALFLNKNDLFSALEPDPKNDYRLYVSPKANSDDGKGGGISNEDQSWRTFGGIQFPNFQSASETALVADRDLAEIGLALASPNLFLAEGERVITIYLNLSGSPTLLNSLTNDMLYDAFRLKFSGEEKWIEPIWEIAGSSGFDPVVEKRILDFLNSAKTAADIAGIEPVEGPVFDDPATGFGDNLRDYDIGLTVASRIISERNKRPGSRFRNLDDVRSIKYIGQDKIDDLIYSFGDPVHSTTIDKQHNRIIIKRTITKDQEAIVAYDEEVLLDPIRTAWPVVKILLNPSSRVNPFIYKYLKDFTIGSMNLVVDVREAKNLLIQNDQSVLDIGKPFQPFGNRPIIGSNFYIGSREVFQKALNELTIRIKWLGLPDLATGFNGHYANYYPNSPARTNHSFIFESKLLDKKSWKTVDADSNKLFSETAGSKLKAEHSICFSNNDPVGEPPSTLVGAIERDENIGQFTEFNQASRKGFLRLTLKGTDFGHREYPTAYTKRVLVSLNAETDDYTDQLPKEPYTPEIEELSVNYVSAETIRTENESDKNYRERVEQFFHVHPMGVVEIKTTASANYLFPQYTNEGELYLGIKDLVPPQNLSVLFQVSEGTSNPDLTPPEVDWSYLACNEWRPFPQQNILADTTKGVITTGVVKFAVPSDACVENTILPGGYHWIRASVPNDSFGIPQLIDVRCQAAKVVFADDENDPNYLSKPMAEKTISKLVVADSAIKKTEQPFTSFGGKVKEESNEFYTRVSERLRHKNRSITIWDYERIILQNFPSVYKVKCLNHTRFDGVYTSINEASPRHVSLIVVSNIRNKNAVDPLKPRTSLVTLYDIDTLIGLGRSPFINVHVHNPIFEEVQVKFNVKFHAGIDIGIYQQKLNESIIRYLSPWAFESGSDIVFGGKIHKSVILNFVEEQPYVDYITCFEMFHIVADDPTNDPQKDVEQAVASTSASVLVSAAVHQIVVLEKEGECACPDNEVITSEIAASDDCPCD